MSCLLVSRHMDDKKGRQIGKTDGESGYNLSKERADGTARPLSLLLRNGCEMIGFQHVIKEGRMLHIILELES